MSPPSSNQVKYRRLALLLMLLMLGGALLGIIVPAGSGWDFANFYDTGGRVAAGQIEDLYNPESSVNGAQPQGTLRFWGTPISGWLYVPLSRLSPSSALTVFKVENTLALFGALILLYLHYRKLALDSWIEPWKFAAAFAFLSLIYQPFWTVYRVGGQTTPTVFLLFVLALLSHSRLRFAWSSLFVVLAILIKPAFAVMLIPLVAVSGLSFSGYAVGWLTLAGVASILTMGWSVQREFLGLMIRGLGLSYAWPYNSSIYVTIENLRLLFPASPGLAALNLAIKVFVVGAFIYVLARARSQEWSSPARRHFEFLMAVSVCLLLSQTVWEHYLSALFLLLMYVVASYRHFSRKGLTLVGAAFLLAIGQNLILIDFLRSEFSLDSFFGLLVMGLFKSGPLLLTLIFLLSQRKELFASYASRLWSGNAENRLPRLQATFVPTGD